MSLLDRLKAEIAAAGPISVADYMTRCLHDPAFGYYATRPALGEDGDFITAPLVSQMFGELIGLWAVETWRRLGAPQHFSLVEAGPGDGTLMSDALRAAKLAPDFLSAAELWLIETSGPLIARQKTVLAAGPLAPRWTESLAGLPGDAPIILVANELLDCMPARQFVRVGDGRDWAERKVGLDQQGELMFGLEPILGLLHPDGSPRDLAIGRVPAPLGRNQIGEVVEVSSGQERFAFDLGDRIAQQNGAALLIDYGDESGSGDTLQALKHHQKVDPLVCPGEADLTVHAEFSTVLARAQAARAWAGILTQGEFLRRLGIEQRAAALSKARPDQAARIGRQLDRLIGEDQMGALFKVVCIHSAGVTPPGFEATA